MKGHTEIYHPSYKQTKRLMGKTKPQDVSLALRFQVDSDHTSHVIEMAPFRTARHPGLNEERTLDQGHSVLRQICDLGVCVTRV